MDRLGADGEGGTSAGVPPSNVKESVTFSPTVATLRSNEAVNVAANADAKSARRHNKETQRQPLRPKGEDRHRVFGSRKLTMFTSL